MKYNGTVSVTSSGKVCNNWSAQTQDFHAVGTRDYEFPDKSVTNARNYCRDPDKSGQLWCFVDDWKREDCGINLCTG